MTAAQALFVRRSVRDTVVAVVVLAGCTLTGVLVAVASESVLVLVGAVAALAVVTVVSAISPRTAVILVFAVSTLSGLTLPTPIGVLRLDQAIVLPALGGVLARWAMDRDGAARVAGRAPTLLAVFLGLYVLANFVSTILMALDVASSLRIVLWLSLSFAAYLLTSVAMARYVSINVLIDDVVGVGAIASAAALLIYVLAGLGIVSFGVQADPVTGQISAKGSFYEANLLGSFAAVTTVLAASELRHRPGGSSRHRLRLLLSLSVGAAATYMSFTRAAWLGLAVGGAFLLLASRPATGRARTIVQGGLILSAFGAALLVSGGAGPFADRVLSLFTDSTGTIAFRSANIGLALSGVADHLFLGLGTNSFGQHFLDPTQNYSRGYLGGLFVATLWDVGVVGLGMLLLAFAALARTLYRGFASIDDTARSQAVGLSAALLCALVAYQATNGFWFAYSWILMGLAGSIPLGVAVGKPSRNLLGGVVGARRIGASSVSHDR